MTTSLNIPCINFIALQVSSEAFCASDASSLSGQCGSRFSNDFGFPRNSCAVAMVSCMHELKLSYVSQKENKALTDLTESLLQRRSAFRSKNDYSLLKDIHDLTGSSDTGITVAIEAAEFQLQRMDCEKLAEDSSFITAVPNVKSMVPFIVYRGDDVDVDDISWLEQKLSNPVGKIMLEFGMNSIKLNGLSGRALSLLKIPDLSPDKKQPKSQSKATKGGIRKSNYDSMTDHQKVPLEAEDAVLQKTDGVKEKAPKDVDDDVAEPSILADHSASESHSLLDEKENTIEHVVLEIQENDDEADAEIKTAMLDKEKSQMRKTNDADECEKENNEYILKTRCQGEINVKKIWFNLAHPTKLKIFQEGSDYSVNLISSIVPSICSWIPVYVDLIKVADHLLHNYYRHRYSVMAYIMGQALPDKGRLYVKVCSDLPNTFRSVTEFKLYFFILTNNCGQ